MIEKLVTSKTRMKILKLFLSHIDDRYYLRELERLLDESLSPLRRQLVKLTNLGILITEEEANLKYYKVNKNFEGLEELKNIILEKVENPKEEIALLPVAASNDMVTALPQQAISNTKQFRYDLAILSFVSIFVLITAAFVVYANNKNMKQVASLIAVKPVSEIAKARAPKAAAGTGEMVSKKWKVMPGNIPVLSSGETGGEKNSKEL